MPLPVLYLEESTSPVPQRASDLLSLPGLHLKLFRDSSLITASAHSIADLAGFLQRLAVLLVPSSRSTCIVHLIECARRDARDSWTPYLASLLMSGFHPFGGRVSRRLGASSVGHLSRLGATSVDIGQLAPEDAYLSYHDVRLTREDVDCIKNDWLTDNVRHRGAPILRTPS